MCYNIRIQRYTGGIVGLKCPYCNHPLRATDVFCPSCKQPLPEYVQSDVPAPGRPLLERLYIRIPLFLLCALAAISILGFGIYKLFYWVQDYQIARLYSRGERTPVVNAITLDDGRAAHSISFFADDGDQIFIPELGSSTTVSGNVARVEIADSVWFSDGISADIESAIVRLSPLLIAENGSRTQLPTLEMTIDPPSSPIDVISPKENNLTVFTSVYPLEVQVVPGSTVLVNGEDVTDVVDRNGLLSANVNVYPIGENNITILVRTPNHLEAREDVVIYRSKLDIEIELDTSVQTQTDTRQMMVSGSCEPGAMIEVDSPYIEESLYINMQTGRFEFLTDLELIGENVVRFRATMDGRADSEIHFNVNYRPTLANYSAAAWKMDYEQLRRLYAQWTGRIFLCEGKIVDVFNEGDEQYVVMDVSENSGEQQLVVLVNESNTGTPTIGRNYSAYAHVDGRYMYKAVYYPMLISLYMDVSDSG